MCFISFISLFLLERLLAAVRFGPAVQCRTKVVRSEDQAAAVRTTRVATAADVFSLDGHFGSTEPPTVAS
jgi:hypothetical protein